MRGERTERASPYLLPVQNLRGEGEWRGGKLEELLCESCDDEGEEEYEDKEADGVSHFNGGGGGVAGFGKPSLRNLEPFPLSE
jgi:hypothetical protein